MTFSLIIPVYNVEPYIRKCLDSILNQDFDDWEALLVDDGSTDGSGAICDEYAARDSRFRVFHQPNGGVSSARNMALDNAQGEWLWFVDPDDWIAPSSLKELAGVVDTHHCDTVFFGIEYYNAGGSLLGTAVQKAVFGKRKEDIIKEADYPPVCYLLNRSVLDSATLRFTEGVPVGEDLEFQYKYLMLCKSPVSTNFRLYGCLRRDGSASNNPLTLKNAAIHIPDVLSRLIDFVEKNDIKESKWLSARLNRLFKSAMSSNFYIPDFREGLQEKIRRANRRLKSLGFSDYRDSAILIGIVNIKLYFAFQRLRKLLKK